MLSALERLRTRYTSLSDCSAAATTDIMGQVSAAMRPLRAALRPLLHWLGGAGWAGDARQPSPGAPSHCPHLHQQLQPELRSGSMGADGASAPEVQGACIDWSQIPGLDERGTALGTAVCPGDAERSISSDEGSVCARAEGHGVRGEGAADRGAGRRGRRRWGEAVRVAADEEQPQGPGLPLHVFSDERAGMNLIWLGEMLHVWRPVIYVWMLYR